MVIPNWKRTLSEKRPILLTGTHLGHIHYVVTIIILIRTVKMSPTANNLEAKHQASVLWTLGHFDVHASEALVYRAATLCHHSNHSLLSMASLFPL